MFFAAFLTSFTFVARRANPPLGGLQPQGSVKPMVSLVCRIVNSKGCGVGVEVGTGVGVLVGGTGVFVDVGIGVFVSVDTGFALGVGIGELQPKRTKATTTSPKSLILCIMFLQSH